MAERLKGLLDSARTKLGGLLGDFPQGFNAGAVAGVAGYPGDIAYMLDTAGRALTGQDTQPAAQDFPGTTEYIASKAGYPVPPSFSGQLGAAIGGVLTPGPGDLAKFAPLGAMFLGAKAKTALPDVLEYAQAMDKAGKSADEIWQTTAKLGQPWFKGADGKWRFEISDKFDVVETPEGLAEVGANIRSGADSLAGPLGRGDTPSITLAQLMAHDELYGAYPDLRRVDIRMTPESGGQYAATFDRIRLNNDDLKRLGSPQTTDDIQKPSSIALHEVQHAIQEREGFGSGGSIGGNGAPSVYSGKLVDTLSQRAKALEKQLDSMDYLSPEHSALQKEYYAIKDRIEGAAAFEGYKRLAGEAEARNVQSRMNMTMDERIALPPWLTQDVPTDQQIVRFGDGPAMSVIPGSAWDSPKLPSVDALARNVNKFLYHSGTADDVAGMKYGIEPTNEGPWIREILNGAVDDPEDIIETATPLAWMSDKPEWVKIKVARKLDKPLSEVTEADIAEHGHLAIINKKTAESAYRVGPEGLSNGEYSVVTNNKGEQLKAYETPLYGETRDFRKMEPFGVERNEWVSTDTVEPLVHLTGDELVQYLRKVEGRSEPLKAAEDFAARRAGKAKPYKEYTGAQ